MRIKLLISTLLLILSSLFVATSSIDVGRVKAQIDPKCAFDLYYILDISGSMSANLIGSSTKKIDMLKSVVTGLNIDIGSANSRTQVGFTAFKGRDTRLPLPDRWQPDWERRHLTTDIFTINNQINSLRPFDGTSMPGAITYSLLGLINESNPDNIPVVILVSDGVPTIMRTVADSHTSLTGWRTYEVENVNAINIKDGNGNFLTPEQVKVLRAPNDPSDLYENPHIAGEILGRTMETSISLNNTVVGPITTIGLYIEGADYNGQTDSQDIVEHFASVNGDNFFTVTTASEMRNALLSKLNETCDEIIPDAGTVKINLPPNDVYTPDQMRVEGHDFTFDKNIDEFTETNHPDGFIKVKTTEITDDGIKSYEIEVSGLRKGEAAYLRNSKNLTAFNKFITSFSARAYSPPPATNILLIGGLPVYDIKMTFLENADTSTLAALSGKLGSGNYEYALLSDVSCVGASRANATHMCFKTKVSTTNFPNGVGNGQLYLKDIVEMDFPGTVTVEGNVLATESIGGFIFPASGSNQDWLAVGGIIDGDVSTNTGQLLNNYLDLESTLIWGNGIDDGKIGQQLVYKTVDTDNPNRATKKATILDITDPNNPNTHTYTNFTFNLNAPGSNPANLEQSSFSSGPEGKIWYNGDGRSTITFEGNTNIAGTGTIIIAGDLVVKGKLSCANGTKFGVIASGSIRFESPEPDIACGAYVALGFVNLGNIIFSGNVNSSGLSATGIFIAKGNITLPSVSPGNNYDMKYDNDFALDPSALFRDILKIVFSTRS